MISVWRRRLVASAAFALLALVAELAGRCATVRIDRALHVEPLATTTTPYYPFLLAGVKISAALALAALAWRIIRAQATVAAGERLLLASHLRVPPRMRLRLSPRRWLAAFAATSLWFLLENDAQRVSHGRWPLLAPWLHTYALVVFAVLAILVALGWGAVRDWLAEVDEYVAAALAHVRRILRAAAGPPCRSRPTDDRGPRRQFGLAFESRPPPPHAA